MRTFAPISVILAILPLFTFAFGIEIQMNTPNLKMKIVFNNLSWDTHLRTGWGFSCLIEGLAQTLLFDTGGEGNILVSNITQMGIDPQMVDVVFLSHIHADHTGGLAYLLEHNPRIIVYLPKSFPESFKQEIDNYNTNVKKVGKAAKLLEGIHSTGEMGGWIKEQALILETSKGLVVITGCAHPGIVDMVIKAKKQLNKRVYLVMGGFHLAGMTSKQISDIIRMLKDMGVEKIAPSHCTGEEAMDLFREAWGDGFLEGGVGAIIELAK